MTVVRYEPWTLMNRLSRDLERLFHAPADASDGVETRGSAVVNSGVAWLPRVDIREEDKQFVLRADLPGVEAKDIEITMEKGVLTIRGRRETEVSKENEHSYRRIERVAGEFSRRFSLPDTADSQAIKARCVNGVLEVVIPKQETVLPRRIDVATH